ncbi:MAG: endonuclease III domain-containing protein [Endomicrobiales bacterium]
MAHRAVLPQDVYTILYSYFGPQGWWPVPLYHPSRYTSPSESEAFEICVGAILTQNTAWKNVEKAIAALRGAGALRGARALAALGKNRLALLIRPSGYFNQKAVRLQGFARHLISCHDGSVHALLAQSEDVARKELLSLSGIGPETADCLLLYAGNKPVFVVDAYTRRLGWRLGWFATDNYAMVQDYFHRSLPRSVRTFNEYHALIVELAKSFCRKRPLCSGCPLSSGCQRIGV